MDAELDAFKTDIDLRLYAVSVGYQEVRRESWRGSCVMRRDADDDKIVIKRNSNGHYVYFSVRDDADNGTIIDFIQHRQRFSLGNVRKALRDWTGRPAPFPAPHFPKLIPTAKDRMRVEAEYRRMKDAPRHAYLEQDRHIPPALLGSHRFAGRIRIDSRGNAVFPHFDADGLCGYEIKNRDFTGFSAGGEKGLGASHTHPEDNRLVLAESAIDYLSYAALFPDESDRTRYVSIGGQLNPKQPGLIAAAAEKMPPGSVIVAAFDADDAGRELAESVKGYVAATGRTDLTFRVSFPSQEGFDWNDVLKGPQNVSFPIARFGI